MKTLIRQLISLQLIISAVALFSIPVEAASIFVYEDFSTTTPAGFVNDDANPGSTFTDGGTGTVYGRDGVIEASTNSNTVSSNSTGATIEFTGEINNNDIDYLGIWLGSMVRYTGGTYTATAESPFGVQLIKKFTRLDPHNDNSNDESHRHMNGLSLYIYQNPGTVFGTTGSQLSNFIYLYEIYRAQRPAIGAGIEPYSNWGYYQSAESNFNLASVTRPDGQSTDLSHAVIGQHLQWNYDDYYSECTTNGSACLDDSGNFTDGIANADPDNTNHIGMRVINDGSKFRFYLNADPDDNDAGLPNEYIEVGSVNASFTENMSVMFGVESGRYDTENQTVRFDDFLIRSVADQGSANTNAEISPTTINEDATAVPFNLVINPTVNTDDAGISEIKITRPSSFGPWDISNINVYTEHGAGPVYSEIGTINAMTIENAGTTCTFTGSFTSQPADGTARLCTSGNELIIRFRAVDSGDNDVVRNDKIGISFSLNAPTSPDAAGSSFAVFLRNEKYDNSHSDNTTGNNGLKYATTGRQKVSAGDAHTYTADSLSVKTLGVPVAYASIVPNVLYVGSPQNIQTFIQAPADANNSDINRVEYTVFRYTASTPANGTCASDTSISNTDCGWTEDSTETALSEFGISGSGFAGSLIDGSLTSSVNGSKAVVDYSGSGIPGDGGLDKITLSASATPTVTSPTWYRVKTTVYNTDVSTSNGHLATTGEPTYFDQYSDYLVLRPEKPSAAAYISESNSCDGNAATVCNNLSESTYTFNLTNNGNDGNNIKQVQINLPDTITTVSNISVNVLQGGSDSFSFDDSSHSGKINFDNTAGSKKLTVDFTGIGPNDGSLGLLGSSSGGKNTATVTMTLTDSIASLSGDTAVNFTGFVDNGNGDALTDNPYTVDGSGTLTITYADPPARGKSEVIRATSYAYSIDNPAGNRDLYVTDSNENVRLTYRIFNPSTVEDPSNVDNNILKAEIDLPAGFATPTSVSSAKGASVNISGSKIELTYTGGIAPGDFDEISFNTVESISIKDSRSFTSKVANNSAGTDFRNTTDLSSDANKIKFVYQPLNAVGYTEVIHPAPGFTADDNESDKSKIDISVAYDNSNKLNTLRYHIKNTGIAGAEIKKLRLYIRKDDAGGWTPAGADSLNSSWLATADSQAFTSVTGSLNGDSSGITCNDDATYSNGYIECDFTGHTDGGVDAGDTAYIQFQMGHLQSTGGDPMPGGQDLSIRARAVNDRSTDTDFYASETYLPQDSSSAHIKAATTAQMGTSTESVEFQVAKPIAYAVTYITPNILLTDNSGSSPTLRLYLKNNGVGINHIYKARINVPATWQGKTAVAATSDKGATVSLSSSVITVDYTGLTDCDTADLYTGTGCLKADSGADSLDYITLNLTHDINTETISTWQVSATNDHTPDTEVFDSATIESGLNNNLYTVIKAEGRITSSQDVNTSSPGNPTQLYTTDTTPTVVARVINRSAGRNIKKILIGHDYILTDISSSVLGDTASSFGNTSEAGYLENNGAPGGNDDGTCDTNEFCQYASFEYSSGLTPGALDDITLQFKKNTAGDVFTPQTDQLTFTVVYDDGTTDAVNTAAYTADGTGGDYISFENKVISGGATSIEFVRPPLPGSAYISNNTTLFNNKGNHLGLDFPGWGNLNGDNSPAGDSYDTLVDDNGFSIYVTNDSSLDGNDLRMVKITAPAALISIISQALADISIIKDPNGTPSTLTEAACSSWDGSTEDYCVDDTDTVDEVLILKFKPGVVTAGAQIKVNTALTKNSSATAAANAAFTVEISNETSISSLSAISAPIAEGPDNTERSLNLYLYEPTVSAQYYVEKTDSAAGEAGDDDMLYKTATGHEVNLFLRNTGHAGSEIRQFSVEIPANSFNTSAGSPGIQINGLTAGTDYTCDSGCGSISSGWYALSGASVTISLNAGNTITAGASRKILFRGLETAATANTGSSPYPADSSSAVTEDKFRVSARINSTYTAPTTGTKVAGKSEIIYLKQPDPSAQAYIYAGDSQLETTGGVPVTTYAYGTAGDSDFNNTTEKRKIRIIVKNTGSGNNDLRKVRLTIPDIFKTEDTGLDGDNDYICESGETCSLTVVDTEISQTDAAGSTSATASPGTQTLTGSTIEVTYSAGEFTPGEVAVYTIPVDYALLDIPDSALTWSVQVSNLDPADYLNASLKSGETLTQAFVYPPSSAEGYLTAGRTFYALNDSGNTQSINDLTGGPFELQYRIKAKGSAIERLALKVPYSFASGAVTLNTAAISSLNKSGSVAIDHTSYNTNGIITFNYSGNPIAAGNEDVITFTYTGTVASSVNETFTIDARYDSSGVCDSVLKLADDIDESINAADQTCLKPVVPAAAGETATFTIETAPFVNLTGTAYPLKDVSDNKLSVSVAVYDEENATILKDYSGNDLIFNTTAGSGYFEFKGSPLSTGTGIPLCTQSGNTFTGCSNERQITLRISAEGYETKTVPVTLTRGLISTTGALEPMRIAAFTTGGDENSENLSVARDNSNETCFKLSIPGDGINETFAARAECLSPVDLKNDSDAGGLEAKFADSAVNAITAGRTGFNAITDIADYRLYFIDLEDASGQDLESVDLLTRDSANRVQDLEVNATITLSYDQTHLDANGINASELAVFNYDYYRDNWVNIGGTVDSTEATVTASVNTLSRYYILAEATAGSGFINNVTVSPRLFTPGRGSRHFNRMTLNFNLSKPVDNYTVGIFSLQGRKIIEYNKPGTYSNGQIFWDGYDSNGNLVSGGIYVYVIQAEGQKYRGTVVVTR